MTASKSVSRTASDALFVKARSVTSTRSGESCRDSIMIPIIRPEVGLKSSCLKVKEHKMRGAFVLFPQATAVMRSAINIWPGWVHWICLPE